MQPGESAARQFRNPGGNYDTATVGGVEVHEAASGKTVTITANAASSGKQFDEWEVKGSTVTLADATASTTTFTMPAWGVTITAYYKPLPLSSIVIETPPTKTVYDEGEEFDAAGMVVKATYEDGSYKHVDGYMGTPSPLTAGTTGVTIIYTYGGVTKETTPLVTVNAISTYTITKHEGSNGHISTYPYGSITAGTSVRIDVEP